MLPLSCASLIAGTTLEVSWALTCPLLVWPALTSLVVQAVHLFLKVYRPGHPFIDHLDRTYLHLTFLDFLHSERTDHPFWHTCVHVFVQAWHLVHASLHGFRQGIISDLLNIGFLTFALTRTD